MSAEIEPDRLAVPITRRTPITRSQAAPYTLRDTPRQLPPAPHLFVNRSHELSAISDKVRKTQDNRAAVIVLTGLGGVGKTAAVLNWAHRHLERFAEGQLYADLADYRRPGGVELSEVLGSFLRVLGVREDYVPSSFPERAAMFRSRTLTRRLLVVLENADLAAQVRPLIPGSGQSVVLVTSRRKLGALITEGAEFIDVAPLTVSDSKLLVTEMVPKLANTDHAAVGDLVKLCGGLPLALCVAGAQLAMRKQWSIPRLIRYLTDEGQRLDRLAFDSEEGVRPMFDAAYGELPDDVKRMYRLLGLHPVPQVSSEAAAATAGLTSEATDELLGVLLSSSLLQEAGEDRYRLHDLVHLHARAMAQRDEPKEAGDAAVGRMIDWYARAAAAADRAVMGEGRWRVSGRKPGESVPRFDKSTAMAWFSAEQSALLAMVQEAWRREIFDTAWWLCESLWAFYYNMKVYSDWLETHRLGITAARRCENRPAEARLRNQLARAFIELRDFESADEQLAAAISVAEGDLRSEAVVLESRGLLFRALRRYGESEDCLRRARDLNCRLGSDRGVVLQTYQLGDLLVQTGRTDDGLRTLTEAMSIAERIDDSMCTAKVGIALGSAYERLERFDDARSVLRSAVQRTRDSRLPVKEAQALEILVKVAQRDNDRDLLRYSAERLVQLYEAAGSPLVNVAKSLLEDEPS
ncbi:MULTISPECIES: tetratricopeptide repeat protein [unclassified Amycolatopsis]|uniref:tetratricopeptide repeat protein n=1 Tax=unclassified Amycolatopsis TaxID=2618356 RepID=UPI0028761628|nr:MULTISPECIES: tetratricopeptide repeat protein [unclassified Amycolatopsis]MDS0139242.1 tetratricopeptide repeat protein [Amycolatopsis sp. 505]MDS0144474.1 tetratricopeptide repeat protein [Amycolatopsis sp. CM201R]